MRCQLFDNLDEPVGQILDLLVCHSQGESSWSRILAMARSVSGSTSPSARAAKFAHFFAPHARQQGQLGVDLYGNGPVILKQVIGVNPEHACDGP